MSSEFKRTFQDAKLPEVALYAAIAATTSIHLTSFHYMIQFLGSTIVAGTVFLLEKKILNFKKSKKYFLLFSVLAVLSSQFFTSLLASFFVIGIILIPSIFFQDLKLPALAILSHIADIFSTRLLLPKGSELNPVANLFIKINPRLGLSLLKILFVVTPVVWSMKNFEEDERTIFLKFVFALGVGMALRNLILFN